MGITTSSSSQFDQFLTQVGYARKERVMEKELDALFEPKLEESFADRETESHERWSMQRIIHGLWMNAGRKLEFPVKSVERTP
ncbi:unnamed protein product [Arabis nemorensis]|uniref:Uncharacterized protein n=1 Tax=Arabis nemorensis TaxID=586526 RepID=A0A565BH90_9BRAS|nr:unnamed protein product [Arabis nemorensis]